MEAHMELSKRQAEIIKTATEIVSNSGIQSLTTKSLAEKISISEPAIYRHFKNKSEIVRAMIRQFDVDFDAVRCSCSGWDLVKKFFVCRIEQVIDEPQWANIMFSEELFIHTEECSGLMKEMMHKHRDLIMENIHIFGSTVLCVVSIPWRHIHTKLDAFAPAGIGHFADIVALAATERRSGNIMRSRL